MRPFIKRTAYASLLTAGVNQLSCERHASRDHTLPCHYVLEYILHTQPLRRKRRGGIFLESLPQFFRLRFKLDGVRFLKPRQILQFPLDCRQLGEMGERQEGPVRRGGNETN